MLNERLSLIREKAASRAYKAYREDYDFGAMADEFEAAGTPLMMRAALRFEKLLEVEKAVILPEDRIALLRTVKKVPSMLTEAEWALANATHWVFDGGKVVNIASNYGDMIREGFPRRRDRIASQLATAQAQGDKQAIALPFGHADLRGCGHGLCTKIRGRGQASGQDGDVAGV